MLSIFLPHPVSHPLQKPLSRSYKIPHSLAAQPYVTELDLRHSLIPDDLIDDLTRSMPAHAGPDLREDRARAKYDYAGFMQRLMDGEKPAALKNGAASRRASGAVANYLRHDGGADDAGDDAPPDSAIALSTPGGYRPGSKGSSRSDGVSSEDDADEEVERAGQGGARLLRSPERSPTRSPVKTSINGRPVVGPA